MASTLKETPTKPKLLPKPGNVKVVRAVYSYVAKNADELTFDEGDILYVYEHTGEWWRAKCKGASGLIPYNYVADGTEVKDPLHDAARRGNMSFLTECISQGVSGTALDAMGNTALYWSAHAGHLDCIGLLLSQSSPPINAQNHLGDTPLHAAASRGHLKVVELLVDSGADASIRNDNGETPEELAMDSAVKNFLHLCRSSSNSRPSNFDPSEYDDDDSDG